MVVSRILQDLENQCDSSLQSIQSVNDSKYLATDELKKIRELVVKQAFVSVFTAWEHFLEDSTIAYALGELSIKGHAPVRYILPRDRDHANQLIKGTAAYPDWSNMENVLKLEEALFENGLPYKAALHGFSSKYKEMKKVRNHIVHNSLKSADEYDTLIRNTLSAAKVGISIENFLLSRKNGICFYELYITHIRNAAKIIAEYEIAT